MELDEFHPTDSELLTFLLRFIAKEPLLDDGFITECNVYNQEPWETYGYGRHCGGGQDYGYHYFITPIQKKRGRTICRNVGENIGSWKEKNDVIISCDNQRISGGKKTLFYETTTKNRNDGKWVMKEYVLSDALLRKLDKSEFRDYAICAIKKKSQKDSSNDRNLDLVQEPMVDTGVNFVEEPIIMVESDGQIQESIISENAMSENNNESEIMDMDTSACDTVLEKKEIQQETIEESILIDDVMQALLELALAELT